MSYSFRRCIVRSAPGLSPELTVSFIITLALTLLTVAYISPGVNGVEYLIF